MTIEERLELHPCSLWCVTRSRVAGGYQVLVLVEGQPMGFGVAKDLATAEDAAWTSAVVSIRTLDRRKHLHLVKR